jgi:hypothetical protein
VIKNHIKQIEEEIEIDVSLMEKKLSELKTLRYQSDFWKELDLKSLIGDCIFSVEEYTANIEDCVKSIMDEFNDKIKRIRNMIDQEDFKQILIYLQELSVEEVVKRPGTPASPEPKEMEKYSSELLVP